MTKNGVKRKLSNVRVTRRLAVPLAGFLLLILATATWWDSKWLAIRKGPLQWSEASTVSALAGPEDGPLAGPEDGHRLPTVTGPEDGPLAGPEDSHRLPTVTGPEDGPLAGPEDGHRLPTVTGWLVNSTACRLPDYHPWDASVAALVRSDQTFGGCRQHMPAKLTQEGRLLRLTAEGSATCRTRCCYRSVTRKDEGSSDDHYRFGDVNVCFGEEKVLEVNDEFIHVKCSCKNKTDVIYEDFRAFIVPKASVTPKSTVTGKVGEKLNVYLLGLDSISRLQFKRFMPDIEALLASDFDAIPMDGLTKIGINTFPNMLAILAGMQMDEIKSLRGEPFDDLPFVWKDFSKLGYVTMFNEDLPDAATFNYLKKGFFTTPTDYYMRPFYRAIEDSRLVRSKQTLCVNQRSQLDLQLQWLQDLMTTQTMSAPQFALLFSSALSHQGPLPYVGAMQDRLAEFLRWYRDSPRHNSSVMLLFSDHGMRFGPIMQTELGGYESRLPLFYAILPPWYAARHPARAAALRANSRRLTTFFDVHATLRTLLRDAGAAEADLPPFQKPGVSLLEPVPPERSCDDAGIASQWCMCGARRPLPLDAAIIGRAAAAAVRHINSVLLRDLQAECAELALTRVTAAFHSRSQRAGQVKDTNIKLTPFEEYVVRFVTEPGAAEFEAMVRAEGSRAGMADQTAPSGEHSEKAKSAEEARREAAEERLTVQEVSRLNVYRGQSDCLLTQWNERRFCYCRNLLG